MSTTSSCGCKSQKSCCSSTSLSCYDKNVNQCVHAYQFLDFNMTGPVWTKQEIPVPRCQKIVGCESCKSDLGLKFQEAVSPFYLQFDRCEEKDLVRKCNKKK